MPALSFVSPLSQTQLPASSSLKIHFLDVGYGDAIVIQLPEGKTLLIDGGKPEDGKKVAEFLREQGIPKIDALIITHFHKDHAGGLLPILKEFVVDKPAHDGGSEILAPFYPPQMPHEDETLQDVLSVLRRRPFKMLKRGDIPTLFSSIRIEILHPEDLSGDQNNDSLVLKIIHHENSFLLAADAGIATQGTLVSIYGDALKSDLIKIPHHATELDTDFLNLVSPGIAILTIGPNPYGAPNLKVVASYRRKGQVFRTDRHGTISITSDGYQLQASTQYE